MDLKKIFNKIKNNRSLVNVIKFFINIFSSLIFIFIIFLTAIFLLSNVKKILNVYGIYIEEDCHLDKSNFFCSYVRVYDNKKYDIKIKNIQGQINLKGIFGTQPVLYLQANNLEGLYINDLKEQPSKKIEGIFYSYLFTNYVDFDLKYGQFIIKNISENTDLTLENLKLKNIKSSVYLKDDVKTIVEKDKKSYNFIILKNKIDIYPSYIQINNVNIKYDKFNILVKNLIFNDDKTFYSNTNLTSIAYDYDGLNIQGIKLNLIASKKKDIDIKLNGKADSVVKSVVKNNINIKNINLNGKLEIKEKENNSLLNGNIKIVLFNTNYDSINLGKVDLNIDIKDNQLYGTLVSKLLEGKFKTQKDKIIGDVNVKSLNKLISLIKKNEITNSIDGLLNGNFIYDNKDKNLNFELNITKPKFIGFEYNIAKIKGNLEINKKILTLKGDINKNISKIYLDGAITDKDYKLNLYFSNASLEDLIFLKDIPIKGIVDGSGNISGDFKNININLLGIGKSFSYEEIDLKNVNYKFNLQNNLINVSGYYQDQLKYNVSINTDKRETDINLMFKNLNLEFTKNYLAKHLELINKFSLDKGSGKLDINVKNKDWIAKLNIPNLKLILQDYNIPINLSIDGVLTTKSKDLKIEVSSNQIKFKDYYIDNIKSTIKILNDDLSYTLNINSEKLNNDLKNLSLISKGLYSLSKNVIKGNINSKLNYNENPFSLDINLSGSLDRYTGNLDVRYKDITVKGKVEGDKEKLVLNTQSLKLPVTKTVSVYLSNIFLSLNIDKNNILNSSGIFSIKNLSIKEKDLVLFEFSELKGLLKDKSVLVSKSYFEGIFKGFVEKFIFNVENSTIDSYIVGEVDKRYISQFLRYANIEGKINFLFNYKGSIKNILTKGRFELEGKNIKVKSAFLSNMLVVNKISIKLKDLLYLSADGSTKSVFGDSSIRLEGSVDLDKKIGNVDINSQLLPIKYQNIFNGVLNTETDIKIDKEKVYIVGKNQITGKINIEPNFLENGNGTQKSDYLKNINLNVKLNTFSPITIEGSWGRVYAEGSLEIINTAYNPEINGNIKISYGKVNFLKVKYNIDFLNINIIKNIAYINGRLSTNVSGTYIYVNLSGTANNIRYDFYSTPPKSKNEILTILLIKQTPEQLASSGFFSIVGNVAKLFLPFKQESEESGLFGTGFNVNVVPSYNPTQGISFNVYIQKYLTRKIYIGLSKPLSNSSTISNFGWYEGGYKLTERSSFVIKFFENNSRSGEITFTLPFDF